MTKTVRLLPRIAVQEELIAGSLIELKWIGAAFDAKTQLIYHRDKWLSPAVRSFLSLCDEISI